MLYVKNASLGKSIGLPTLKNEYSKNKYLNCKCLLQIS